jgi:predicted dehydrogenase/threonine dehydrogenase-like Zn-dependent dehydrogenase
MKQVIQSARTGELRVGDVPAPAVRPGHVLVRTTASLISAGTERMTVDFARKSLVGKAQARPDLVRKVIDKAKRDGIAATLRSVRARLDEPLPLGYSAAGVVVEVGEGLEGEFRVGQRVAMAGAGIANHAELNLVPRQLLATVPDVVAVLGTGLVGLLAVRLLVLAGARVVAIDRNAGRLALAGRLGAELTLDITADGISRSVGALTGGRGVDGVLVAAADETNAALTLAAEIARDRGRISIVGKVGTEFPFGDYMKKELSIVVSRSYGPGRYDNEFEENGVKYPVGFVRWTETDNLAECLRLMRNEVERRLDPAPLITHRFPIADAEAAYKLVLEGAEPHLGVLLTYPTAFHEAPLIPATTTASGQCRIGMIGAGAFARTVLLPALREMKGVALHTIVTTRGATAEHARAAYGFANGTTDIARVLTASDIDAVVIATPHDTHADLTARALESGKAVFVEKPLALDRAQLDRIVAARRTASRFLTVGFNRRFAPMAIKARARIAALPGAKLGVIRINSGPPPAEGESGGRILGEMCHFIDLARYLIGSPIRTVHAAATTGKAEPCDDTIATLRFGDGSVATIAYTGLGDSADIKERIEVFGAGTIVRIEDFRQLTVVGGGKTADTRDRLGQDKGHRAELAAFVEAVLGRRAAPIDEGELIETSLATIAVLESLRTGHPVEL